MKTLISATTEISFSRIIAEEEKSCQYCFSSTDKGPKAIPCDSEDASYRVFIAIPFHAPEVFENLFSFYCRERDLFYYLI